MKSSLDHLPESKRRELAQEEHHHQPGSADDNGSQTGEPLDPRIVRIDQSLGRQLAREQAKLFRAGDDNEPHGR